jgi:phosphopantothenoylcysteine decarboxylase/phosphopantothenate--cysteine ligase
MQKKEIINKLKSWRVIVTAGGTIEPIDPVRYIGNHSSGKMGMAIAKVLSRISNDLILIHANMTEKIPENIKSIQSLTVKDMHDAIKKNLKKKTILIMAAAVSDFKIKKASDSKIKKGSKLTLELVPTIDILKSIGKNKTKDQIFIGFAAETENIIKNAQLKLKTKNLDLIIANPIDTKHNPFGNDLNKVYFIGKNLNKEFPLLKKVKIAHEIIHHICTDFI